MIRISIVLACVAAAGCAASGAASAGPERGGRIGEPVDTVCFTGGLSGFYEAGYKALVMSRSVNDAYLVETGHCPNLKSVEGLKIDDPSMCLSRGDHLLVYDMQFPREGHSSDRPDRCLVTAIHEWIEGEAESEDL